MLEVEEAVARVLGSVEPLGAERVLLALARERALAEDVVSERLLPPWDNSAMDGFAVRAGDVAPHRPLPISAVHGAGSNPAPLAPGTVARIMTGAPVPPGADAIVPREEVAEQTPERVSFTAAATVGEHVRRAGSDVAVGDRVLAKGDAIGPGEIGLLAALGRTLVAVHRQPRVAIVSTGSELVEADRALAAGRIVGSNGWALAAQCAEAGALPTVLPLVADDKPSLRAAFAEALTADVVLSSGGVSVGDFDYVKDVLAELGVEQQFWKVAMKPGKPIVFGLRPRAAGLGDGGRATPVFGLPGNPASSMVAFELFVRPALRRLLGFREGWERPRAEVRLLGGYEAGGKRRHYVRARVRREGGVLVATRNAAQGSGMLRSMVGVNALVEVPAGEGALPDGARVTALLLEAV